ncbi:DsbA family protein [Chelativorans sp. EGI FJ00035]|uniref:DsbA family protein n=1 Tax=Chelativorans salis TaxID=2978478 RepID=A0ABT2LIN0_9HYPH|nr:DsbA family protein [Chelativorans sp. EGI FJ00035]
MHLSYLFDPLCGWCYGAAPVIGGLMQRSGFAVELIPTGLFAGEGAFPISDGFAAHAWDADQRIARLSGQPFSEAYRRNVLGNRRSRVNSGPATLALTAVRLTAPEREFDTLHAIQRARYEGGRDNGDAAVVADVLDAFALGDAARRFSSPDDELLSANRARIAEGRAAMQRFGARGVPALVAAEQDDPRLVDSSLLYSGVDALAGALNGS